MRGGVEALDEAREGCCACLTHLPAARRAPGMPTCLQDGVEEGNTLDHNLAAFVHVIGPVGSTAHR